MWQCDDCDDTTTTTNEPNNFSLSLQELQCNCSATHWPCIRIVSVLQHNCKYSFSVYPFIPTPPAGACSEGEKKKACRRAVRSVCDCIMCSFSVVCDRYTNTSVTVTVTAVVFCIIVTVTCIVYELNNNYECHDHDCHDMTVMTCRTWHDITVSRTSSHRHTHTHRHRHTHTVSHTQHTLHTARTHTLDKKWIIDHRSSIIFCLKIHYIISVSAKYINK